MYVLHAHWQYPTTPAEDGGMLFWVEDSEAPPLPKRRGRRGKKPQPHPFCALPEVTKELLGSFDPQVAGSQFSFVTLFLPTIAFGPLPSPQVVHDWDVFEADEPALRPWVVGGAWLSPIDAFYLLTALPGPEDLPPKLVIGADVRFWLIVTGLVLETLAQQKLLPLLAQADRAGRAFHGRWLPILDAPQDGPRIARLLAGMPPLCRAEAETLEAVPPPRLVLETFLNIMTDALARLWAEPPGVVRNRRQPKGDVNLAWLASLFAAEPQVTGAAAQLKYLYQGHQLWLRSLHVAGDKSFRVAFRLEAPLQQSQTGDEKDWQLHFLLQARDDPSLLVPARQVWQTKGAVLKALDRRFRQPQEKLLTGLGYAARLFEPLRESLKTAKPDSSNLLTREAFAFLREAAPLLEASGFGVLVPPWWNKPGTRLGVRLSMGSAKTLGQEIIPGRAMNFDKLVRYKWELSIGDSTLTREEFEALVALKSPLVQIRGQWVQLDPEQIEAAIQFWQNQSAEAEISLQEALRLGLGAGETVAGLPVEDVQLEGWLADWMDRFTGNEKLAELPQPQGLQAQLRPYQRYGYSWIDFLRRWGLGACLADDMGLGKTIQTIAMILREKEDRGRLPGPVLLICPTSVVANWSKEVQRFAPALTTLMHQGSDRLRDQALVERARESDMVLTSYAIARRDAATLQQVRWFGLVLDEAQNIKNPQAKQTRAIRQLAAQFRLALTGTPVENRLSELWSIMHFLNPGYLGSRQSFKQSFGRPIERYGDEAAAQHLRQLVSPLILRRIKSDPTVIQDLPDKQEMKVYCALSEEQATLYESVVQTAMEEVVEADGIQRKGLVLSMLMKLKQVCNHPAQFLHQVGEGTSLDVVRETSRSGKLARLSE
ncbi:MAG: DEAD/DEAH box helicase, partial [Anaerolineae bacterium]|nr:DEAD/DEAH box helicase [Anaerolineae bacterium]